MKILLLNQCFYPDVVSTAQHLTDLALELKNRGHDVTVIASDRGYDDPNTRFPRREIWNGINIHRVRATGLGKRARWRRAVDFASFFLSCGARMLLTPNVELVLGMTSPPMISVLAAFLASLNGWHFAFWAMDLNPDEAIAAGWLRESSATSKLLNAMSRYRLAHAQKIIVLDKFMRERLLGKGVAQEKMLVIPPWAHDEVRYDQLGREKFRAAHNLSDKFVVMYSGNHSPCHPLNTILEAARKLSDNSYIVFCFVGGGSELHKVKAFAAEQGLSNIITLPYQPMSELAGSLSAADLHAVVMGDPFVGIIHPCKVYNILSVAAPVIYIGPTESHIVEALSSLNGDACLAAHGEVDKVASYITKRASERDWLFKARAPRATAAAFAKQSVMPALVEALETLCGAGSRDGHVAAEPDARRARVAQSSREN